MIRLDPELPAWFAQGRAAFFFALSPMLNCESLTPEQTRHEFWVIIFPGSNLTMMHWTVQNVAKQPGVTSCGAQSHLWKALTAVDLAPGGFAYRGLPAKNRRHRKVLPGL